MKKIVLILMGILLVLSGCTNRTGSTDSTKKTADKSNQPKQILKEIDDPVAIDHPVVLEEAEDTVQEEVLAIEKKIVLIEGTTLETRFAVPEGYNRMDAEKGSLTAFIREYPLKEDGSPVLLYDGSEKINQSAHAAVFLLPMEEVNLQQCADSIMRICAEYYWNTSQQEKIKFHFTNGFLCEYSKWRDGYRVDVDGNNVSWSKDTSYDASYDTFVKYLRTVFSYAGTLSMESLESETIPISDMNVGDVIINGGSPGHVVMVVDLCENEEGKKAYLLGQGYMPAQEFHVIINPKHKDDPWYYEEEIQFPLETIEYTFTDEKMVRRLIY